MDLALFILRLVVGLLLAGHGAQKLFGWFGGPGRAGTTGWLGSIGFRPAHLWAWLVAGVEFFGGLLFTLGLFSPLGSLGIAGSMLMATSRVHWPKLWASAGGFELPLVNLAVVIAVGIAGPGVISLDNAFNTTLPGPLTVLGIIVLLALWIIGHMTSTAKPRQAQTTQSR